MILFFIYISCFCCVVFFSLHFGKEMFTEMLKCEIGLNWQIGNVTLQALKCSQWGFSAHSTKYKCTNIYQVRIICAINVLNVSHVKYGCAYIVHTYIWVRVNKIICVKEIYGFACWTKFSYYTNAVTYICACVLNLSCVNLIMPFECMFVCTHVFVGFL